MPLLVNGGSTEKNARSFLGKLRKLNGDTAVVDALRDCIRARTVDPTSWLAKALPPPGTPDTPEAEAKRAAAEAKRRADSNAEAARLLGFELPTDGDVIDAAN